MATVRNRGFTLAEILVASTITTFIAVVAVGALKTVSDSAQTVTRHSETVTEVRFAARMLARDLANVYRDQDPRAMRLVGTSQSADSAMAFLRFYATGRTNARHGQPEGDVYEVEYFLGKGAAIEAASQDQLGSSTLYRRLWPNPDEDRPPGGILVSLAQNIDVFQIRFYDGRQWTTDWPEEMRSLPQLIEVTLVMLPAKGQGDPIIETLLANFPRLATAMDAASAVESGRPGGQNQPPQGEGPTAAPR